MTSLTISCNSADCYGSSFDGLLYTGTTSAYVVTSPTAGDHITVWIPFTLPIPKMTITSATLRVVASASGTAGGEEFKIVASAEDNAANPSTYTDLSGKTATTANIYPATLPVTNNTEYSYNVTTIVQEILNRSGWVYGNNIGIMFLSITLDSTKRCEIAMTEHATLAEPKLDIVVPTFFPRGAGML